MNITDPIERKARELHECESRRETIRTALLELIETAQNENRALNDFETDIFNEYEVEALALKRYIPLLRDSLDADRQMAENARGMAVWSA